MICMMLDAKTTISHHYIFSKQRNIHDSQLPPRTNRSTEEQGIKIVVLQGDTFGSLLASVQVDRICQDVVKAGLGCRYKDILSVSMLGLVDDLIGITEAGYQAQQMN